MIKSDDILAAELVDALVAKHGAEESRRLLAATLSLFRGPEPHDLRKASLDWSVRCLQACFLEPVQDLVKEHPADDVDEEGETFWSGTRRYPKVSSLSESDKAQLEVVATAAALRLDLAGQAPSRGAAEAVTMEEVHAAFQRVEAEEAEVAGRDEMLWAEFEYAGGEAQEVGKSQRDTEGNGSGGDGATEASAHRLAMALLERCVALSEENE
mgnify:CR=1 FL=1